MRIEGYEDEAEDDSNELQSKKSRISYRIFMMAGASLAGEAYLHRYLEKGMAVCCFRQALSNGKPLS